MWAGAGTRENKMIIEEFTLDNEDTIKSFIDDMGRYYVGVPSPALLDKVFVSYYDEMVPIEMCASITVQSPEILIVRPWEPKMNKVIEKAIHAANIGLNPQADDEVVKVYLPRHLKENDIKIFGLIKVRAEKAKVAIRQNRKKARDKTKNLNTDEKSDIESKIQKQTDDSISRVEKLLNNKKKKMKL